MATQPGAYQNVTAPTFGVTAKDPPPEGQMVSPLTLILTAANKNISTAYALTNQSMSQVRTLFIDNTENTQPLNVTHGLGNVSTVVPSGGGAFIPTTSTGGQYFFTVGIDNAPPSNTPIPIALYNYEIPPAVWGTQVITVTQSVPIGTIMLWYGSAASIPSGFGLCDGTVYNRTDGAGTIASPNLVNLFVLGANAASQGTSGGSKKILQANLPNVNFTISNLGGVLDNTNGSPWNLGTGGGQQLYSNPPITVNSGGAGADYLPPYEALCYIIKF